MRDIWPNYEDIAEHLSSAMKPEVFRRIYNGIEKSNEAWNAIPVKGGELFDWNETSTYIQEPPFFMNMSPEPAPITAIEGARVLVKVGDSITTDHISPAGNIAANSPAGQHLQENNITPTNFNSYGSRRGNDRVMTRGTFANIRLRNQLAPGTEGGWTNYLPTDEQMSIYEASLKYKEINTPTIVLAGKDYGMGSSRDWAAKGTFLLGAKAVIAESFERIHRSNLVGMGVLPLQFREGENAASHGLTGKEHFTIYVDNDLKPLQYINVAIITKDRGPIQLTVQCRIDTPVEIDYYRNGGILHTVLRNIWQSEKAAV